MLSVCPCDRVRPPTILGNQAGGVAALAGDYDMLAAAAANLAPGFAQFGFAMGLMGRTRSLPLEITRSSASGCAARPGSAHAAKRINEVDAKLRIRADILQLEFNSLRTRGQSLESVPLAKTVILLETADSKRTGSGS
jgi:hypothetical protein